MREIVSSAFPLDAFLHVEPLIYPAEMQPNYVLASTATNGC